MALIVGSSVIELGAGCALPSLLSATLAEAPSLVVITDYPDVNIMTNLISNVEHNRPHYNPRSTVHALGYDWGQDTRPLLSVSCVLILMVVQKAHRTITETFFLLSSRHRLRMKASTSSSCRTCCTSIGRTTSSYNHSRPSFARTRPRAHTLLLASTLKLTSVTTSCVRRDELVSRSRKARSNLCGAGLWKYLGVGWTWSSSESGRTCADGG